MVAGAIGFVVMTILVFSLASQAQKGDAYLEQLKRGEGDCLEER